MNDVQLKCACGKVRGVAHNVTPKAGNRLVCHCEDCQAFANYLGTENILDEYGGTDIFQMSAAQVEFTSGLEYIRSIRLTSKGMIRFYTNCCRTPIGNTISANMPFVGVIHNFMDDDGAREDNLGPVRAHTYIKKDSPVQHLNTPLIRVVPRMILKLFTWKLKDSKKPNPFFNQDGEPVSKPTILG